MDERRKGDRRGDTRDRLLTDVQVAKMADVSVNTVKYWRQVGLLPFVKVGRHPRIWLSVFMALYKKPKGASPLEKNGLPDKMHIAGDIRRP